ncbi:MAG: arylesterase [Sulfuricellaceae bacterium]
MIRLLLLLGCLWFCAAANAAPAILVLGDSLSAEYGIPRNSGWVSLLQRRLEQRNSDYSLINASQSGETTDGGRARIASLLAQHRPAIVILELGGNDGLRGLPLTATRENLAAIIQSCRNHQARVLLIGMKMPPNYGVAYTRQFEENYRELASRYKIPLLPFLLEGLGEKREWFQADGLHPIATAQPAVLENVWKKLKPMLNDK